MQLRSFFTTAQYSACMSTDATLTYPSAPFSVSPVNQLAAPEKEEAGATSGGLVVTKARSHQLEGYRKAPLLVKKSDWQTECLPDHKGFF